jgi:hypothetical protein
VDLADAQSAATIAIDDPRFFGNIVPDQDYPELEDIAFSQNMLSNYASLQAARGRTIASQHETTQQESFEFRNISDSRDLSQSPMGRGRNTLEDSGLVDVGYIPGEDQYVRGSGQSNKSRVSEIENTRFERSRASMSTLARSSMSSGGGMALRFDDDIPAFEDPIDEVFGGEEAPPLGYYDEMVEEMPMEYDQGPMEEYNEQGDEEQAGIVSPIVDATEDVPTRTKAKPAVRAIVKRGKKQRVTVDETVELSSRAIKQRMADMGPILRRRPGDYLEKWIKPKSQVMISRAAVPPSARGLCPELLALFSMTMPTGGNKLPFPLKSGRGELVQGGRDSVSIEANRDASLSASDVKARRLSSSSMIEGQGEQEQELEGEGSQKRFSPQEFEEDYGDQGLGFEGGYEPELDFAFNAQEEPSFPTSRELGDISDLGSDVAGGALKSWKGKDIESEKVATGHQSADWNSRTAMVHDVLQEQLKDTNSVSFKDISKGISRRTAAACFLEVLQLKTWGYIDVAQSKPFADINITATDKLWLQEGDVTSQIQT